MVTVLLGLGGNEGEPAAQLAEALCRLEPRVAVRRISSLYRSAPVGYADQADFLNAVCEARTRLEAPELLAHVKEIEEAMGRVPSFRNAPRPIDIDVLDYAARVIDLPGLTVPHPGIASRAFVLYPLCELCPEWRHPVLGSTARELLGRLPVHERVEKVGALSSFR